MFILLSVVLIVIIVKVYTVLTNFQCASKKCLIGKIAIVTGGNSGIGFETVLDLASRGCKVIIADVTNGEKIAMKIRKDTENPNIFWKYIDLGSLASVREFCADFKKTENRLDILINNAGCGGFKGYTKDGLQKVMQINYFGHFLLTHLLIDLLKKSDAARIVSVSSALAFAHTLSKPDLINSEPEVRILKFDETLQYGNSKLCTLIAMKVMAEKLRTHGISCYSLHPGAINTAIYKTSLERMKANKFVVFKYLVLCNILFLLFGKTIREGAQTTLHCAISEDVKDLSGKYFWNGKVFLEPSAAKNKDLRMEIWKQSETLVNLKDEEKIT